MKTVDEWMSREVVTLEETDDLSLASTILHLGRIRHLPVVRDGRLVGLVTSREVLKAMAGRPGDATLARDAMTRRLITVTASTPLREAIHLMLENKFGCLPVVEGRDTLVGILTEADLLRFAEGALESLDRRDLAAQFDADA